MARLKYRMYVINYTIQGLHYTGTITMQYYDSYKSTNFL